jgi:DNA polymerase-3 subunit delta
MRKLTPDNVLISLRKGVLEPYYLFYGPEEFWVQLTLNRIKKEFIPDTVKDFNLETIYAGDVPAQEILNRARLVPFMSPQRLIIVRDVENFPKGELDLFLPYLDNPVDSTCLIWITEKKELKGPFFKRLQECGRAVNFKKLSEQHLYGWIRKRAGELGLRIDQEAIGFLFQMVGSSLRDIYSELWKISVRFPDSRIGVAQIRELATFSRLFTVFDLVDYVSQKDIPHAFEALQRLFETQGRDSSAVLGLLGMLARQIRLIEKTKSGLKIGKGKKGVIERLKPLPNFVINKCIAQEKHWQEQEIEEALNYLYEADGLIRTGSKGDLVLESLVVWLCVPRP